MPAGGPPLQARTCIIVLLVALLVAPPMAFAGEGDPGIFPPRNDRFAFAERLRLLDARQDEREQDTHGASEEWNEPAACGVGATVWFTLGPLEGASGLLRVDTAGSDFDTVVAVYRGPDLARLKTVACNDDAGAGSTHSSLTFLAVPGETYHVQVGSALHASGHLRLAVRDALLPTL